jgi:hypothetical protein
MFDRKELEKWHADKFGGAEKGSWMRRIDNHRGASPFWSHCTMPVRSSAKVGDGAWCLPFVRFQATGPRASAACESSRFTRPVPGAMHDRGGVRITPWNDSPQAAIQQHE